MILTGSAIKKGIEKKDITIFPFHTAQINPNSYNYRLGRKLRKFAGFNGSVSVFEDIELPEEGYVLDPQIMYLGHTYETIGSSRYAMSLIGRSSMGRLGLFLQLSANLGHTAPPHQWTLELFAAKPIRIYPEMIIGQISFWTNHGDIPLYDGTYGFFDGPHESTYNHIRNL